MGVSLGVQGETGERAGTGSTAKDKGQLDARVVEPAADRDGVVRVEDVARWRVVDDDALGYRAAELRQVLRADVGGSDVARARRAGTRESLTLT